MKRSWLANLILFSALTLRAETPPLSQASESVAAQPSLGFGEILADYQNDKRTFLLGEEQRRDVLSEIYALKKKIKLMAEELATLSDQVLVAQSSAQTTAKEIALLEDKMARQRKQLRQRLREVYKSAGRSQLAALFSAQSLYEFEQSHMALQMLARRDQELLKNYQQTITDLNSKRQTLKGQVQNLMVARDRLRSGEVVMLGEQKRKYILVSRLGRVRDQFAQRLSSLRGELGEDWQMQLGATQFFERKGQLPAPVAQKTVQSFGLRASSFANVRMSHKGLRFAAEQDHDVQAIHAGRVEFAGVLEGYGAVVVVDHGDHYYAVYGQLDHVVSTPNQMVREGQALGQIKAGGRGLYFEIRHYSEPENPEPWFGAPQSAGVRRVALAKDNYDNNHGSQHDNKMEQQ